MKPNKTKTLDYEELARKHICEEEDGVRKAIFSSKVWMDREISRLAKAFHQIRQGTLEDCAKLVDKFDKQWQEIEEEPRCLFEAYDMAHAIRQLKEE